MKALRGVVRGNTIELQGEAGFADGAEVDILVRECLSPLAWGEGIRRSAGAFSDHPEQDDLILEQLEADRSNSRFRDE